MSDGDEVSVFTVPSSPTTGQKVTFVAQASDPDRTARVEIWIDGRRVKTCADSVCRYLGGPFRAGRVKYAATAYDEAGNPASTGWKVLTVRAGDTKPPLLRIHHRPARPKSKPTVSNTISGQLRGKPELVKLVKNVGAYSLDQPGISFTTPVHEGSFEFRDLPDGRYRLSPIPGGKFDVISKPTHHDVRSRREGPSQSVRFEIKGIMEG